MKRLFQILTGLFKKKKDQSSLTGLCNKKVLKIIASCYTIEQLNSVAYWLEKLSRNKKVMSALSSYGLNMALLGKSYSLRERNEFKH